MVYRLPGLPTPSQNLEVCFSFGVFRSPRLPNAGLMPELYSCTVLFSRRCRRARGDVQKQQGNLRGLRVAYSAIQRRARAALRLRLVGNHHTLHAPAPSPCVTPPSNAILNAYNRTRRGWMRTRPARVCGGLLLLGPSLSATIMCMTDVPFPRHPDSATRNVVNMPAS